MYISFYEYSQIVPRRHPSSTRYGAEAKPREHIKVEQREAVNSFFNTWSHRKLIVISPFTWQISGASGCHTNSKWFSVRSVDFFDHVLLIAFISS